MINLENLNRQHSALADEVNFIETQVKKNRTDINVEETALHINKLSGQLKIHLLEEDKFLYPKLLKCEDKEVQKMAQQYIDEMGNLAEAYTQYKNSYNISSKIEKNLEGFISDTIKVMDVLKRRIVKENTGLYALIKTRNL